MEYDQAACKLMVVLRAFEVVIKPNLEGCNISTKSIIYMIAIGEANFVGGSWKEYVD